MLKKLIVWSNFMWMVSAMVAWFLLFEGIALLWDHSGGQINSSKKKQNIPLSKLWHSWGGLFWVLRHPSGKGGNCRGKLRTEITPNSPLIRPWVGQRPSPPPIQGWSGVVLPLVLREHLQPGRRETSKPRKRGRITPGLFPCFFKKHHLSHLKDQQFLISKKLAHFSTSESGDIWNWSREKIGWTGFNRSKKRNDQLEEV